MEELLLAEFHLHLWPVAAAPGWLCPGQGAIRGGMGSMLSRCCRPHGRCAMVAERALPQDPVVASEAKPAPCHGTISYGDAASHPALGAGHA